MSGRELLLSAAGLLVLAGCSLDYRGAGYSDKLSESTPDTVLYDFSTTTVHGSEPYFRIQASVASTYDKKNLTVLSGVKFEQFDSKGKVIASGTADSAVYHTDTENAELSGHIEMYSDTEKARISAVSLSWNNSAKTLTGKTDSIVSIVKNTGSGISGTGFEAELKTRTVKFSGNVHGKWVEENSN